MTDQRKFNFEISLSVLNHLGRNLYRNFVTVLGEAISNSWDADAKNVWIAIDKETSSFSIKDDGNGMTAEDFQGKFLKIGYSKRKDGTQKTLRKRPFIGAKGIGKLALLSCADKISIFTKTKATQYVGGVIDNSGLDAAITSDLTPQEYPLGQLNFELVSKELKEHTNGTVIHFYKTKEHIRNSIAHLKKLLAMTFRFSLLDKDFNIYVNDQLVTMDDLKDLSTNTEFWWSINAFSDQLTDTFWKTAKIPIPVTTALDIKGFLATVVLPRHLKITGTDERATVDLFVNGRLREKNIIRHIPTQRITESYIYGQIHFDAMDKSGVDPFTSSREGIKEEDQNFQALLSFLKTKLLPQIIDEWDDLRLKRGSEGDDENTDRATRRQRKAKSLYSSVKEEYEPEAGSTNRDQVDSWLSELAPDAEFNISSYVDCFLCENLTRKYVESHSVPHTPAATKEMAEWRAREASRLGEANISFPVRRDKSGLSYLDLDVMARMIDGKLSTTKDASLVRDAISYRPVRNVVGHTGLLTPTAKSHLSTTFENIKGRVRKLISKKS